MYCNKPCKLCNKLIISNSVTVLTVNGVDTLVVDIPASTYRNGEKYCIVIAQAIPTTATITMPVAVSIGGVTTTVYPLTTKNCAQVVACQVRTRTRYAVCVSTTATSGVFRVLDSLSCAPNNALASLPIAATPAPAQVRTVKSATTKQTAAKVADNKKSEVTEK